MTDEPKNELSTEVWEPPPFKGTDLLPVRLSNTTIAPADEEIVAGLNIEVEDMVVPRLKLLQGMSKEVTEDGQPAGKLYNTSLRQVIEPPARGLVIFHSKSRALFPQAGRPECNGLEKCIAPNALEGTTYGSCETCSYKEWPKDADGKEIKGQSPPCSLSNNFVLLTPEGPCVVRFARTSFRPGRDFLGDVNYAGVNFWHHPVVLSVKGKDKLLAGGQTSRYFTLDLRWDRSIVVPPASKAMARHVWETLKRSWDAGRLDVGAADEIEDPET